MGCTQCAEMFVWDIVVCCDRRWIEQPRRRNENELNFGVLERMRLGAPRDLFDSRSRAVPEKAAVLGDTVWVLVPITICLMFESEGKFMGASERWASREASRRDGRDT
jgi:hypothetical protein